jgi:hypothetical protein
MFKHFIFQNGTIMFLNNCYLCSIYLEYTEFFALKNTSKHVGEGAYLSIFSAPSLSFESWLQVCQAGSDDSASLDTSNSLWYKLTFLSWELLCCYGLNVCIPSKFLCWNSNPQVMIAGCRPFGRWLVYEVEPSGMWLVSLKKTSKGACFPFYPVRTVRRQRSINRMQALIRHRTWPYRCPDLTSAISQLFISHSVNGILLRAAWTDQDICVEFYSHLLNQLSLWKVIWLSYLWQSVGAG